MASLDLKKSIKGLNFFVRNLPYFGGKRTAGDQHVFDRRGAIVITDKQITKKNGEIIKIRGITDMGGSSMAISSPNSSSNNVDASKAMDAYRSWPYAAMKAIADEISGIEWKVYRTKPNGEIEEVTEHELIDFLEAVNDFQTGPEFKHTLSDHLEATGNAYIYLEGVKDVTSKPTAMYLLDPGRVRVVLDKTTYPYKISRYDFTIDGRIFTYQPYQILQVKFPNPNDPYRGIGTIQGIADWIDNDNNLTEFMRQFFKNGAQVGVTFETDMASEDQLQTLKDSFDEQHAGVGNAYKGIFLPKGVKKSANEVKFDDIGFDETSNNNRDKILAGFRVSKTILGGAEDVNRATAETADYVFARRTIKPKMILICSYLNEFLVPRFGEDIFLTFDDPVTEDRAQLANEMKNIMGGNPVMTVNEARAEYLGIDAVEGGDKLMMPNNYIPATDAGVMPSTIGASMKNKSSKNKTLRLGYIPARTNVAKTQFSRNLKARNDIKDILTEKILKIVSVKKKSIKEMTDQEYDEVILKEKAQRTGPYAEKIRAALRELNEKQKKEVLTNLQRAIKSTKDIDPKKLFNMNSWISLTVEALSRIAKELFGVESRLALELIDHPGLDVENSPEAKKALQHALELLSQSYNQNTLDMLEAKLNEGLSQGLSIDGLTGLIQDIYAFKDEIAAERVALTESNRIANEAGKMAWEQSGVVKEVQWVTSRRDNVCPFCQDMDGEIIDIKENFFDKGDTMNVDGETMNLDYSAVGGPPLHPNCHCGIRPIVDTSIEASAKPADPEVAEAEKALKELDE